METLKSNWIATSLLSILFLVLVLFVANATESKETPKKEKALTTVVFRYTPPATDPYTEANVKNTANWTPALSACPTPTGTEDAPCSIAVPLANTVGGNGLQIDPLKVSIQTEESKDEDTHRVMEASDEEEYQSPINKTLTP